MNAGEALERDDIQGLLFSAYSHLPFAGFSLLSATDPSAARAWLGASGRFTNATAKNDDRSVNIALTYDGLRHIGLPQHVLDTFAFAFKGRMVDPHRSRVLGDVGRDAPANWEWGTDGAVHFLLLAYARTPELREELLAELKSGLNAAGLSVLAEFQSDADPEGREHFGFKDGTGQPVIRGTGNERRQLARTGHATDLPPGEFLLGHQNLYGYASESPTVAAADDPSGILGPTHDLGFNGTYFVLRQLEQDVPRFWRFVEQQLDNPNPAERDAALDWLGTRFVGRWPSGAPLELTPEHDDLNLIDANNFQYESADPDGLRCPIGAHMRRANPRDMNGMDPTTKLPLASLHRIMRRARSYGDRIEDRLVDDDKKRGLLFMCFNADLERQFELVQQSWINSPIFGGLSGEIDPFIGNHSQGGDTFTIQAAPLRRRLHDLGDFITVRGGAYFFVPGFRALRYLSGL